jgi:hypothetical protein
MYVKSLSFLALTAVSRVVHAAVLFQNHGTLSGWDDLPVPEHQGTRSEVNNVFYEGPTALKMTQTYDANYDGRYHSEVVYNDGYRKGQTRFYGFMFRLQSDWQFAPAQSYNLAQFITPPFNTACDDWMPTTMVWLVGDQLATRVKSGDVCHQHTTEWKNLATVSAGAWHKVVIQANWQSDSTGYFKLWFDGAKVVEFFNIPTTVSDDKQFQFRVGLYANGWHDDAGGMKGSQPFRQVWYDEIGMGTTFADADPDQW